jgi:hypothetical protein
MQSYKRIIAKIEDSDPKDGLSFLIDELNEPLDFEGEKLLQCLVIIRDKIE